MTTPDVLALLPLLTVSAAALAVLSAVAVRRHHLGAAMLTWIGLAAALASLAPAASVAPQQITALFILDGYGLFYMALLIAASLAVAVLA
jgi:NADH-quinone oxidoreductase subunit N